MTYESTARLALQSRGIDNPTPLQVIQQMLAIKEMAAKLEEPLAIVVEATQDIPPVPMRKREGALQNEEKERGFAIRQLFRTCPSHAAEVAGVDFATLISQGWHFDAVLVPRVRSLALGSATHREFADRVNRLELGVKLDGRAAMELRWALVGGRPTQAPINDETMAEVKRLVAAGWPVREVAGAFALNVSTVYRWLTGTRRTRQLAECGTYGAYKRHRKKGEEPCEPCKAANRSYNAKLRAVAA